jgi:hypothetical protein
MPDHWLKRVRAGLPAQFGERQGVVADDGPQTGADCAETRPRSHRDAVRQSQLLDDAIAVRVKANIVDIRRIEMRE